MWNRKKIQAKWSYFRAQRLQPTGNFTEFVVRVYYAVLACCMEGDGRSCPIGQVRNRRLSRFVYRGIYDRPDHDYDMVLEDCKRNLLQMGYLHLSEDGMRIFVDRPLDFLLEGEHERYLSMARETFCLPSAQAPKKSPGVPVDLICPECGGSRLSEAARAPRLRGIGLAQACQMPLKELVDWVAGVPDSLPEEMRPMAESICESFQTVAKRLMDLGLSYLSLDRAAASLSTGERQRMQLARAVRNRTTGVLYVLDEPSIGLHPSNIVGLNAVMHDLIADGNSIILVDHDTQILSEADWLIEMGPEAGAGGGYVITQGSIPQVIAQKESMIGPFLAGTANMRIRKPIAREDIFALGKLHLSTDAIHTVKSLEIDIPKGRLTVVTGVSGSGKTTMVLESLIPGLEAKLNGEHFPAHVKSITAEGVAHVKLIDASPIGINVRSTVATYANVHDELRKIYAKTADAKNKKYKAGDFSYNTGKLRCLVCDGTGQISLDVQFLPDVDVPCPECGGSRYTREAWEICYENKQGMRYSLPQMMEMDVTTALQATQEWKVVHQRLEVLKNLGLGYLTLGEETPSLSGGEAQRLKLASEMGRGQSDSVFVFDEPTIGLHPLDVQTLLQVFQALIDNGATVLVIEHDLDVIRNADYIIDMGPGGGEDGGRVVAVGTPEQIRANADSITGKYL